MKKILLISLFIIATLFLVNSTLLAQPAADATGTPEAYKVTQKQVDISYDGGDTWSVAKSEEMTFDITSANAGAVVGAYMSNFTPTATSFKIRPRPSNTFVLKGFVHYNSRTYYTDPTDTSTADGDGEGTSDVAGTRDAAWLEANTTYEEASITIYGMTANQAMAASSCETNDVTIPSGGNKSIIIKFNPTNTLNLYDMGAAGCALMPGPPTVTITEQ